MADPKTLELLQIGEDLSDDRCCVDTDIPGELDELDQDLHYLLSKFLDGEAKLLAVNAEIGSFGNTHKSGTELWRFVGLQLRKEIRV